MFRRNIQPNRSVIALNRFNILDNKTLIGVWPQLAYFKIRPVIGLSGLDKLCLIGQRYPADKAKPACARKLNIDIAGGAVTLHQLTAQILTGGQDGTTHTAQTVLVKLNAFLCLICQIVCLLGQRFVQTLIVQLSDFG